MAEGTFKDGELYNGVLIDVSNGITEYNGTIKDGKRYNGKGR